MIVNFIHIYFFQSKKGIHHLFLIAIQNHQTGIKYLIQFFIKRVTSNNLQKYFLFLVPRCVLYSNILIIKREVIHFNGLLNLLIMNNHPLPNQQGFERKQIFNELNLKFRLFLNLPINHANVANAENELEKK